jgi:hypothetical protein
MLSGDDWGKDSQQVPHHKLAQIKDSETKLQFNHNLLKTDGNTNETSSYVNLKSLRHNHQSSMLAR